MLTDNHRQAGRRAERQTPEPERVARRFNSRKALIRAPGTLQIELSWRKLTQQTRTPEPPCTLSLAQRTGLVSWGLPPVLPAAGGARLTSSGLALSITAIGKASATCIIGGTRYKRSRSRRFLLSMMLNAFG